MKSIEEVLACDDSHRETVRIDDWGTDVLVMSMTALERSEIEKEFSGKRNAGSDPAAFRAAVLARCLKNDDGSPWATPEQAKQLLNKSADNVERLFEAACRVSGFSKRDVKELEKN